MRPSRFVSASLAFLLILASQGCASQNTRLSKELPPGGTQYAWRAPLVLRPGTVTVDMTTPARKVYTPGLGEELFWMSATALLTFGAAFLAAPDVIARHQMTVLELPPGCETSWVEVTNRAYRHPWLGRAEARNSEELRNSVLKLLEEAVRNDLALRGQELTIEVEPKGANDPQGAQALEDIGRRLSAPALAVADVSFTIESQPKKCSMQMRLSAQMHLDAPGAKVTLTPGAVLDRSSSLPVEHWAKNPEAGGEALRSLVEQFGKDIVDALPKPPRR
jgi:hypothetical protein